jgi:hypothetical protein
MRADALDWSRLGMVELLVPEEVDAGDVVKMIRRGEAVETCREVIAVRDTLLHMSDGEIVDLNHARRPRLILVWDESTEELVEECKRLLGRVAMMKESPRLQRDRLAQAYLNLSILAGELTPGKDEDTDLKLIRIVRGVWRWVQDNQFLLWKPDEKRNTPFIGVHDDAAGVYYLKKSVIRDIADIIEVPVSQMMFILNRNKMVAKPKSFRLSGHRAMCVGISIKDLNREAKRVGATTAL